MVGAGRFHGVWRLVEWWLVDGAYYRAQAGCTQEVFYEFPQVVGQPRVATEVFFGGYVANQAFATEVFFGGYRGTVATV